MSKELSEDVLDQESGEGSGSDWGSLNVSLTGVEDPSLKPIWLVPEQEGRNMLKNATPFRETLEGQVAEGKLSQAEAEELAKKVDEDWEQAAKK